MSDEPVRPPRRRSTRAVPPTIDLKAESTVTEPQNDAVPASPVDEPSENATPQDSPDTPSPPEPETPQSTAELPPEPPSPTPTSEPLPERPSAPIGKAVLAASLVALLIGGAAGFAASQLAGTLAPSENTDLTGRIAAIEQALVARVLQSDFDRLEKTLATQGTNLQRSVAALQASTSERVANLEKSLGGPGEGPLPELQDRIARLEEQLGAIDPAQIDDASRKTASLDKRLSATEQALTKAAPEASAAGARLALVERALDALKAGRSFEPELQALGTLGVEAGQIETLRAASAQPAALPALADRFPELTAKASPQPAADAPPSASYLDRFIAGAQSLVRVRKADDPSVEGQALQASIVTALNADRPREALSDWQRLPEPLKAQTQSWSQDLQRHVAARETLDRLATQAVPDLSRSNQP